MKLANLAGVRFKERPSDCVVDSHALLVRGDYIKQVMNGVFSSYAPLVRVTRKIEQILREEMDALGGQEVELPVVMPASLWQASGRYAKIGPELARFRDRSGNELVLGMTHEEAAVQLVRDEAQSYAQYPFMIYQIFATMSSDELKKSVAKRLLVLQRSINLIQFIRLQIQHFISAFCFFMGNLL